MRFKTKMTNKSIDKAMIQEEKELLLKDLCARQPYRTYVLVDYIDEYNVREVLNAYHIIGLKHYTGDDGLINIKPYLRPMSSMTEEEKEEYKHIAPGICWVKTSF